MSDTMSAVIKAKSDQLNASDIIGTELTITVESTQIRENQLYIYYFKCGNRPWRVSKGMSNIIAQAWGRDTSRFIGQKVTLFYDPSVKWAGKEVGGIRICGISGISGISTFLVKINRTQSKDYIVRPILIVDAEKDALEYAKKGYDSFIKWYKTLDSYDKSKVNIDDVKKICGKDN